MRVLRDCNDSRVMSHHGTQFDRETAVLARDAGSEQGACLVPQGNGVPGIRDPRHTRPIGRLEFRCRGGRDECRDGVRVRVFLVDREAEDTLPGGLRGHRCRVPPLPLIGYRREIATARSDVHRAIGIGNEVAVRIAQRHRHDALIRPVRLEHVSVNLHGRRLGRCRPRDELQVRAVTDGCVTDQRGGNGVPHNGRAERDVHDPRTV